MDQPTIDITADTLHQIQRREQLARQVLQEIRSFNIDQPRNGPTFTIAQAADLAFRSPSAIRVAESDGRLDPQDRNEHNRRENYTLSQVNKMREVFGTRPWRDAADGPAMIAVQNFKGGVGKSTISVHLAQYLAIKGYRVLLIDADAQASTTMMFGYIPDDDFGPYDSIYASLVVDEETYRPLKELIRPTHYEGLDLIPANLTLYNAEYELAASMRSYGAKILTKLRQELAEVQDNYDVVIMDPPPALGMISMSVLYAANGLIVPMPPNVLDFASTTSFLSMLGQNMQTLQKAGLEADYRFIQIVLSRNEDKWAQNQITSIANQVFQRTILDHEIKASAEFGNCTAQQKSVYDVGETTTNHHVRKRCLQMLNAVNEDIEKLIRAQWPNTPAIERQERN